MERMELKLKLKGGGELLLSYQLDLIMLHSDFISGQYAPDAVGIEITTHKTFVKVAFHPVKPVHFQNYQGWFFEPEHKDELLSFFKKLGYPCPQTPVIDLDD